ncbi:unnamed protein product [Cercopithifilaria johnstoni]|uniref:Uncharacterized protein n=1 Tax=Cercopithifilaria johnstoni TaxID=2874296 RepID=A0A8J2LZ88_9BILA|nr:unnamed protein product [Cercopithifilaria johnstoni]
MENISLEGFIYDCSQNGIRTIYCPLIGEVCIDETTEVISRSRKPAVGMWCTFKASYQEGRKWCARKVVLMSYPRLKCLMGEDECTVKGTAVVCNISGDSGYLWNDYIGLIAIEGQMVYQLKPLTAVEFQAVPLRKSGTPAYFMAKKVSVESEIVFQSEVLLFTQKAEIKADGRAYVSDCAITLLDIAYSRQTIVPATLSVLYYKTYIDSASGIGIYATADSNIVAGIKDDFFTTERCFQPYGEHQEVELFEDALNSLTVMSSQLSVVDDETPIIKIDISPTGSVDELVETNKNDHSSKVVDSLAGDSNCSVNQSLESCSSLNFRILDDELDSENKFLPKAIAQELLRSRLTFRTNPRLFEIIVADRKRFVCQFQEDIWDNEFIEYLLHKVKEVKRSQSENDGKCDDINRLIYQSQNNIESSKKEFHDELKAHKEEKPPSAQHIQSIETVEDIKNDLQMRNDVGSSRKLSVTNRTVSGMDLKSLSNPEESIFVGKTAPTWIDEMDKLCVKVLSNARLRNFVSVNKNGNDLLRDIMHYLEYQMTEEEMKEELGIPLSEVTPECFNIVQKERALGICRKLMEMNGFERIANSKIPKIPEE